MSIISVAPPIHKAAGLAGRTASPPRAAAAGQASSQPGRHPATSSHSQPPPARTGPAGPRRNYREERGDFTIPIILLMALLLAVTALTYVWPKAVSTRLNVEHIGEEALKAGVIYAAQTAQLDDDEAAKLALVREQARDFIERSRLHGVTLTLVEFPSCGQFQGQSYVRAAFRWSFINPRSAVNIPRPVTESTQAASTPDLGICD